MTQLLEAIIGLQWGDEGKAKILDERIELAQGQNDNKRVVVARFQGGPNAGHTMYVPQAGGKLVKFISHAAPSGIVSNTDIAIGPQVAFDPEKFAKELGEAEELFGFTGRVMISERTGILFDYHIKLDAWKENAGMTSIGTTKSGIGPFYMDNANRATRITFADYVSPRFPDRLRKVIELKRAELQLAGVLTPDYIEELIAAHDPIRKRLSTSAERLEYRLRDYLNNGDHIFLEGAQGTMLDVDMGSIPDVSSSHLLAPHAFPSLGLPMNRFTIIGIEKVYPTRVGSGFMPTTQTEGEGFGPRVAYNAGEFGATTGRRRRVGLPDWVIIRRAVFLNQCNSIFLTRVDNVQDEELRVCTSYQLDGEVTPEVPLDLSSVKKPIYEPKTFSWHLWGGSADLSEPQAVHSELANQRAAYVSAGFDELPQGLRNYVQAHDEFVNRPIIGVSIGPARGETVLREL